MMTTKERLITVGDAFSVLRRFWLLILACTLILGALGYLYADMTKTVYYETYSKVIVQMATVDEFAGPDSTDIARARAIAKSLEEEMGNDRLIKNVRRYFADRRVDRPNDNWEDLSPAAYTDGAIKNMISAAAQESSQHVTITTKAPTPGLAVHLAEAVAGELQASVVDVVGNCTITPTELQRTPQRQVISSKRPIILAAGLGAVASFVGAFFYVFLDSRVQNSREILGNYAETYPLLGIVPGKKSKRGGKKVLLGPCDACVREAYNEIRVTLAARLRDLGIGSPVVGVTSAGEENGHRQPAVNLAVAYARLGKKVLLVDADFRDEGLLSLLFEEGEAVGLADALRGEQPCYVELGCEKLSFLPRGSAPENAADLLGGSAMTAFFSAVREKFDLVIVNLPSAHAYADAATAAAALDGVVLGIRIGNDRHKDLRRALYLLETAALPVLGMVALDK